MNKEVIERLNYIEETSAGESETWQDPVTTKFYRVDITIVRHWDTIQEL